MPKQKIVLVAAISISILFAGYYGVFYPQETDAQTASLQKVKRNKLQKLLASQMAGMKRKGAQCEWKSEGKVPKEIVAEVMKKCRKSIDQKYKACAKAEGWLLDIQIDAKDGKGQEEFEELVCRGGCSGTGAGDSFPLSIKSEALDVQGTNFEIVCSAACHTWSCDQPQKTDTSFEIFNYQNNQTSLCTKQTPCTIPTVTANETPKSYELIFSTPAGIKVEQYPLKAWVRFARKESNSIPWGQEIILKNTAMSCGEFSQDKKSCLKTSGSITFSGAPPGQYAITLSDKQRHLLFESQNSIVVVE